jgi:hypothetical protein
MKGDFSRVTFRSTKHYSGVRLLQGRMLLDADVNEHSDILTYRDHTAAHDIVGPCGAPYHAAGFEVTVQGGNLLIGAGRYYVDGVLCENEQPVSLAATPAVPDIPSQPDLPDEPLPTQSGLYLAYLDVWQRHLTAVERPELREVALGGPDTSTRTKTVWQVKLERVGEADATLTCSQFADDWAPANTQSTGQLRAQAEPPADETNLCLPPPGAGYRRLENQLYRVEIHTGSEAEVGPSFKWSRDNASMVARLENIAGDVLTVSDAGKDAVLGFALGQWVELSDEARTLRGQPGVLVELETVQGTALTVRAWPSNTPLTMADFGAQPTVRRWDSPGAVALTTGSFLDLEDGVQVEFTAGAYRSGDYWLIPARSLSGDVEWPRDATGPLFEPRHGTAHHYCTLALLQFDGEGWQRQSDCRRLFPPTTELTSVFYVSGDGQEAMPGQMLPRPLQVGVAHGQWPVAGAQVRFSITAGTGTLTVGNTTGSTLIAQTGADGIAECAWQLDGTTPSQQVEVSLIDAPNSPIRFNANLSRAAAVAYDPSACPDLAAAGVNTVQLAIDALCQRAPQEEPGIGIQRIVTADGGLLRNDTLVPVTRLVGGLRIVCDAPLSPESGGGVPTSPSSSFPDSSVAAKPTCFITLDLPYPLGSERDVWGFRGVVGFQPLILSATVMVQGNELLWVPTQPAAAWLQQALFQRLNIQEAADRVLCHLTVKGNFIWRAGSGDDPTIYVDGEGFGRPGPNGRIDIRLPSSDGRRGGDFEMWFWLMPPAPTPTVTVPTSPTVTVTSPTLTVTFPTAPTIPTITTPVPTFTTPPPTVITRPGPGGIPARPGGVTAPTTIVSRQRRGGAVRGRTPLTAVRGISEASARKLTAAGIRTTEALAAATPDAVATALGFRSQTRAQNLIDEAKRLLGQS